MRAGLGGALFSGSAPPKIVVAQGSVTIAGPDGYCVDQSQTRDSESGIFVLLASCASIAKNARASKPRAPALLTATVSHSNDANITGSLDRLSGYFRSNPGRVALARDGQPGSVEILKTQSSGGVFFLHAIDKSPNYQTGLSQEYWRALLDVDGRIVTLNVIGFQDKPIGDADELATLKSFVVRVLRENAATP